MLIAGALGDALGKPHEFKNWNPGPYTGKLEYNLKRFNRFQKSNTYYPPGQVTDDTEMAASLFYSLLSTDFEYDSETTALEYMRWANSRTKMIGKNTAKLFKGVKTYKGYLKRYDKLYPNEEARSRMQSNGPLMRCGILAILDSEEAVIKDINLTNPNEINIEVELVFISSLRDAIQGLGKDEIYDNVVEKVKNPLISDFLTDEEINISGKDKGWVMYGFYLAFYSLIHFDNFRDAMDYVIHRGGDTDTNACIAGYLLGAYYGYDNMISDEITCENIEILFEDDTSGSYTEMPDGEIKSEQRPERFWVKNYLSDENLNIIYEHYN